MPSTGLNASSTTGFLTTKKRPEQPRKRNQRVMTGPKAWPIFDVPMRCARNRTMMIASVMATTLPCPSPSRRWPSSIVRRPSMAVVTVTAGVRTPSARSAAPPSMAGTMSHLACRRTRLYRAKMPPSPWLSALSETSTYFTVVSSVTVQITSERAPKMNSWFTVPMPPLPETRALVTYIGLVPMSPYTTPRVTSMPAMLAGMAAAFFSLLILSLP